MDVDSNKEKKVFDELWVLYERALGANDFRLAFDILVQIKSYY